MSKEKLLKIAEQLQFDINKNVTEQTVQEQLNDLLTEVIDLLENVE